MVFYFTLLCMGLVVNTQKKVKEKTFNWAYGCSCSPGERSTLTRKGSVLDCFRVTFRSCGLSLLSMELLSINRWQSLSYWVSEGVVNPLILRNPKKLGSKLPVTSGCCCNKEAAEIDMCRCSATFVV